MSPPRSALEIINQYRGIEDFRQNGLGKCFEELAEARHIPRQGMTQNRRGIWVERFTAPPNLMTTVENEQERQPNEMVFKEFMDFLQFMDGYERNVQDNPPTIVQEYLRQ